MKDLSAWNAATDAFFGERSVVAFDLDDTLTVNGEFPARVHAALEDVRAAGWLTVLVTGRSAGWVDAIIKLFPFDAVVGENGGLLSFWPQRKLRRREREEARKLFWTPAGYAQAPPDGIRERHANATARILARFPRARVASDQPYRIYDLAIDFAEEVDPPLSLADAELIREEFAALGATAKVSSIHVNGWWGNFTKEQGLRELGAHYGFDILKNLIYVGDSPNDGPLFAVAGMSVGVANIRHFIGKSDFHWPRYVAKEAGGAGALELLQACLARK